MLMARWKARVKFLLSVIRLLFLSLTADALQGKTCQNSLLFGGGGSVSAKISGGRLVGKPEYDFLFVIIELFSLALTVETLQAEICGHE